MQVSRLMFLLFLSLTTSLQAWHFGDKSSDSKTEIIICNNGLKQSLEKVQQKSKEDTITYCFISFFEKEHWCFPSLNEAATAACRAAGTL